jgi:hypothetical protein
MRFLGLIVTLFMAGGIATADQAKDVRAADDVQLTYTKWFSPGFPTMVGVVGGDIVGSFGGAVLERTPVGDGTVKLRARYEVIGNDPSQSFTALVEGLQDNRTHPATAVLNGVVTAGWLAGEPVHAEYTVITCTQAPNHVCFTGTIRVLGESGDKTAGN